MNVLVTGAAGFLGRQVVAALLQRGHHVRALVRPATDVASLPFAEQVDVVRWDLRSPAFDAAVLADVDAVVHLAAVVVGEATSQFAGTIVGTERLLAAMRQAGVTRLVLASSMSVYDWRARRRWLDEAAPLESRLYERDEYAIAKTWQERLATRFILSCGGRLTILRPGFLWGPGRMWVDGVGVRCGRWILVNGPRRRLPLCYVENAAASFADAVADHDRGAAPCQVFNVVDDDHVRAWRHARECVRDHSVKAWTIPLPYLATTVLVRVSHAVGRLVFGSQLRLPGLLTPVRYAARFGAYRFSNEKLRRQTAGAAYRTYDECLRRCREAAHVFSDTASSGDESHADEARADADTTTGVPSLADA